jgi:hypothetical protein
MEAHHSITVTYFELPQLLHCVWQALQPVVAEVKVLQLFKLTDAFWQADQLVVGQVQPCKLVQLFQDPAQPADARVSDLLTHEVDT